MIESDPLAKTLDATVILIHVADVRGGARAFQQRLATGQQVVELGTGEPDLPGVHAAA